jgi:sec-independent protein translocase protein TatB
MFNIGWPEMVILVVAALMILGPERLPGAIRWTAQSLRQVRDYASGATSQLRSELGPELDELRGPLEELNELRKPISDLARPLNELRGMTPRGMVTKHLLGGDDSLLTGKFDRPTSIPEAQPEPSAYTPPAPPKPLAHNEKPPIDFDAT